LDGKVYIDGNEIMHLTKDEKDAMLAYIALLKAAHEMKKIMHH
jgi:hypothetical protein